MGFRSWLRRRFKRPSRTRERTATHEVAANPLDGRQEVPPYLPVDASQHTHACVIAAALAAGAQDGCKLAVRRVSIANPEYQRVAVIASALAASALEKSSWSVKRIYKISEEKGSHVDAAQIQDLG